MGVGRDVRGLKIMEYKRCRNIWDVERELRENLSGGRDVMICERRGEEGGRYGGRIAMETGRE